MKKFINYTILITSVLILLYSLVSFQTSIDQDTLQYMVEVDPSFQISNFVLFLTVASDNFFNAPVIVNMTFIFAVINLIYVYYYFKNEKNSFKISILAILNAFVFTFIAVSRLYFTYLVEYTGVNNTRIDNWLFYINVTVEEYVGLHIPTFVFQAAFLIIILFTLAIINNTIDKFKNSKKHS